MCSQTQPAPPAPENEAGAAPQGPLPFTFPPGSPFVDMLQKQQEQRINGLREKLADREDTIEKLTEDLNAWESNSLINDLEAANDENRKLRKLLNVVERAALAGLLLLGARWVLKGDH